MKKLLILVLVVASFSCKKNPGILDPTSYEPTNLYGVKDSLLIEGEYLVFLNEEKYPPLINVWNSTFVKDTIGIQRIENLRINAIREFAKSQNLKVADDDIFIYAFSGFLVRGENKNKLTELLSNLRDVKDVNQNFYMQNTRARMQSGEPLLQNTRARMQDHPEWGYNELLYTSSAVTYLGGGNPTPPSEKKIWIIDSGIDRTHQDLAGQVNQNLSKSFVEGGLNPASDNDPFNDYWGHGTSCAGLAAAKAANRGNPNPALIGMTGVSPGANLVSLKVFGQDPESQYSWIIEAIEYASKRNRLSEGDVLSLSLGGKVTNCEFPVLTQKLIELAKLKKIYFVFAACNGYNFVGEDANKFVPACINGDRIFTIGSMDLNYQTGVTRYSQFSNFGAPPIDWVTPGNFIFTIYPGNKYAVMQGTSMSTALMAGLLHLTNGTLEIQAQIPGIHGESYTYPVPRKE